MKEKQNMNPIKNMAYCSSCGDLVEFTVQNEIIEKEFHGVMGQNPIIKFPFRTGRCMECRCEVAIDNEYNYRRAKAAWIAYGKGNGIYSEKWLRSKGFED